MAYFGNNTEGAALEKQCAKCRYGSGACPIFTTQLEFNYDAVNNEVATQILNSLIKNDGTCAMYEEFEEDFNITEKPKLSAREYWKDQFGEYPENDAEKLAVTMMEQYHREMSGK